MCVIVRLIGFLPQTDTKMYMSTVLKESLEDFCKAPLLSFVDNSIDDLQSYGYIFYTQNVSQIPSKREKWPKISFLEGSNLVPRDRVTPVIAYIHPSALCLTYLNKSLKWLTLRNLNFITFKICIFQTRYSIKIILDKLKTKFIFDFSFTNVIIEKYTNKSEKWLICLYVISIIFSFWQ